MPFNATELTNNFIPAWGLCLTRVFHECNFAVRDNDDKVVLKCTVDIVSAVLQSTWCRSGTRQSFHQQQSHSRLLSQQHWTLISKLSISKQLWYQPSLQTSQNFSASSHLSTPPLVFRSIRERCFTSSLMIWDVFYSKFPLPSHSDSAPSITENLPALTSVSEFKMNKSNSSF